MLIKYINKIVYLKKNINASETKYQPTRYVNLHYHQDAWIQSDHCINRGCNQILSVIMLCCSFMRCFCSMLKWSFKNLDLPIDDFVYLLKLKTKVQKHVTVVVY